MRLAMGLILAAILLLPTMAGRAEPTEPQSLPLLVRWRAAEGQFSQWETAGHGTEIAPDGTIRLTPTGLMRRADGTRYGEAFSPVYEGAAFEEAIPSWNATTPVGTWLDIKVRARKDGVWSEWFYIATWTSQNSDVIHRQSYANQGNTWFTIAVDTLVMRAGQGQAEALQLKLGLVSNNADTPSVRTVGIALSMHPRSNPPLSQDDPRYANSALSVPPCSQMVYPDGGEVWCSPTSTAMVLGYWTQQAGGDPGPCEPRVRAAVAGVYDFVYDGHGNWPFNTAYAATQGLEGYVVRFNSLAEAEPWLARGVPLVVSYAWNVGELTGAPLPMSYGHLAVLVGLDEAGNPRLHDPAFPSNATVPTTYNRAQWERLWLSRSGGTAYVIAPPLYFEVQDEALFLPLVGIE